MPKIKRESEISQAQPEAKTIWQNKTVEIKCLEI